MTLAQMLLPAVPAIPLALAALLAVPAVRRNALALLWLAPLPALAAALLAWNAPALVLGDGLYRPVFALDEPGALLLGVAALLWSAAGAYAATYQRQAPDSTRFALCWLLAAGGCLGVFVAGDLVLLYLLLAVMTVGATGLVFHDEASPARRAAGTYLGIALFGETVVLAGMVLLAASVGTLRIDALVSALPTLPQRDLVLALLLTGFAIKAGLVPLHVWMPLAHAAAPMPASAVLSGAVVKAGIIGLIRFLPVDPSLAQAGEWLALAGMGTALYAVAVGLTQQHPKVVLAYSSVSQMGFIAAVIGMGVVHGDGGTPLLAAFYAAHHVLVKGALFLAVGVIAASSGTRLRFNMALAAFIAIGLGGLPLAGGAIAKYAVKAPLGEGWAAIAALVSAIGTCALMFHFLRCVHAVADSKSDARAPAGLAWPWQTTAVAAIGLPWLLYAFLIGDPAAAMTPAALWATAWPAVVGVALALLLGKVGAALPAVPAGDVAALLERARKAVIDGLPALLRLDGVLREWAVATLLLAGIALSLLLALRLA